MLTHGHEHAGIALRFEGVSHRIDFQALVGESVWLYPQNDVFVDLADARERDGGDVRFGVGGTKVIDITPTSPASCSPTNAGAQHEIRCAYLVGADGSHSICRMQVPGASGDITSASTRSPGSASWPRRRAALPSSSTPIPREVSR